MRGARFRHLKQDERGISAVVAAIAIVGLFGALVFSLDAGNLWASIGPGVKNGCTMACSSVSH